MKTTLTFTKKQISGTPVGPASRFPALRDPIKSTIEARLDEDDGLFVNYGMFSDSLPYTMQDDYDLSQKQMLVFDSAILENDFLRAEFVLPLGGRLWSLFDKTGLGPRRCRRRVEKAGTGPENHQSRIPRHHHLNRHILAVHRAESLRDHRKVHCQ